MSVTEQESRSKCPEGIDRTCPIGFGDCPDCEYWKEGECQYNEKN